MIRDGDVWELMPALVGACGAMKLHVCSRQGYLGRDPENSCEIWVFRCIEQVSRTALGQCDVPIP